MKGVHRQTFLKALADAGVRGVKKDGRKAEVDFELWYNARYSTLEKGLDGYMDFVRKGKIWWKLHKSEYTEYEL